MRPSWHLQYVNCLCTNMNRLVWHLYKFLPCCESACHFPLSYSMEYIYIIKGKRWNGTLLTSKTMWPLARIKGDERGPACQCNAFCKRVTEMSFKKMAVLQAMCFPMAHWFTDGLVQNKVLQIQIHCVNALQRTIIFIILLHITDSVCFASC